MSEEIDLEGLRKAKRMALIYAKIYGNELYEKIYRVLDSAEKRLAKSGGKSE
jgi:hypothetical protein